MFVCHPQNETKIPGGLLFFVILNTKNSGGYPPSMLNPNDPSARRAEIFFDGPLRTWANGLEMTSEIF